MPIKSDNDAEREERIAEILRRIRDAQKRVEELAAEGRRAAEEHARDESQQPGGRQQSSRRPGRQP